MRDGRGWGGFVKESNGGNNAPEALETGEWRYYGTVTLLADDNTLVVIDLLDVARIEPAPEIAERMNDVLRSRGWLA